MPELRPVDMSYQSFGEGTPVIFLHGFPFDGTIWLPVARLLQDRMRVILPDLRGFGSSPVTEDVYSMRLLAEDVARLMDRLELEQAVLVGHSMGGYVALAFTQSYPNRVSGLGLISTQADSDSPERRQSRYKTAEAVAHKGARIVASSMVDNLTPDPEIQSAIREIILRSQPTGIVGALKGMAERANMSDSLIHMTMPAVVIAGTADQILPLERMQVLAQMLPKGWLIEVPGGGHMLMLEQPQVIAGALKELVAKTAG